MDWHVIDTLRTQYTQQKSAHSDDLNLRLYRALSWLDKAFASGNDPDVQFIMFWISFNAIYAKELPERGADRANFVDFLQRICQLDKDKKLYRLIWEEYPQSIRIMLDNRYIFQPFWDFHNGKISQKAWQEDFDKANKKALMALSKQDTHAMLMVIFDRLYTLRNQVVHGGATYKSRLNRAQIKDGCQILQSLTPIMISIMLATPKHDWGKPFYTVVE